MTARREEVILTGKTSESGDDNGDQEADDGDKIDLW